jgi:F-type H+-transporting ATPase subunit b
MFDSRFMRCDCHADRTLGVRARVRAFALAAFVIVSAAASSATLVAVQEHAAAGEAEAPHGQTLIQSIAKVVNFAILGGILFYFLKTPISTYLVSRATHIRQGLVTASEMRSAATAQLGEIERKMQALPGELEALRVQGAEDVKAERARIAQAAAAERERLIAQTHREIETRLRMARRQLTEHAANLAVKIAEERIKRTITPEDQLRLVDRYAAELTEAR